jgi:hypothetical protein
MTSGDMRDIVAAVGRDIESGVAKPHSASPPARSLQTGFSTKQTTRRIQPGNHQRDQQPTRG